MTIPMTTTQTPGLTLPTAAGNVPATVKTPASPASNIAFGNSGAATFDKVQFGNTDRAPVLFDLSKDRERRPISVTIHEKDGKPDGTATIITHPYNFRGLGYVNPGDYLRVLIPGQGKVLLQTLGWEQKNGPIYELTRCRVVTEPLPSNVTTAFEPPALEPAKGLKALWRWLGAQG